MTPPSLLPINLVCFGGMCLGEVLGKALAPLNCRGIALPELLLCGVGGVCARAADVGGYFIAILATAPLLHMMFPLAARLASSSLLDCWHCYSGGVRDCPCILFCRCPRQTNPLLIVNELVHKSSKELEAACRPVVCTDDLLVKKVGVNANNAEDSEVEPLCPILCGKIVVHPQLVGTDPVVSVNGAGAIVVLGDCLLAGRPQ